MHLKGVFVFNQLSFRIIWCHHYTGGTKLFKRNTKFHKTLNYN
jgi:hypothetical protein